MYPVVTKNENHTTSQRANTVGGDIQQNRSAVHRNNYGNVTQQWPETANDKRKNDNLMIRIRDDEKSNSRLDNYTKEIKQSSLKDNLPRKIISSIKQTTVMSQANDYFSAVVQGGGAEKQHNTTQNTSAAQNNREKRYLSPLANPSVAQYRNHSLVADSSATNPKYQTGIEMISQFSNQLTAGGAVSITTRQRGGQVDGHFQQNYHLDQRDTLTAGSMYPMSSHHHHQTSNTSQQQQYVHLPTAPSSRNNQVYARYRTQSMVPPINVQRHGSTADNTSPRPSIMMNDLKFPTSGHNSKQQTVGQNFAMARRTVVSTHDKKSLYSQNQQKRGQTVSPSMIRGTPADYIKRTTRTTEQLSEKQQTSVGGHPSSFIHQIPVALYSMNNNSNRLNQIKRSSVTKSEVRNNKAPSPLSLMKKVALQQVLESSNKQATPEPRSFYIQSEADKDAFSKRQEDLERSLLQKQLTAVSDAEEKQKQLSQQEGDVINIDGYKTVTVKQTELDEEVVANTMIKVPVIARRDSEFSPAYSMPMNSTLAKNSTSYIFAINDSQTALEKDQLSYMKHEQELKNVINGTNKRKTSLQQSPMRQQQNQSKQYQHNTTTANSQSNRRALQLNNQFNIKEDNTDVSESGGQGIQTTQLSNTSQTRLDFMTAKSTNLKRGEKIAFQTIQAANDKNNKKALVTHRAGGGGGPFSRMTKFHRLEIKPSPSHRKTAKMTDLKILEQQQRERIERENSLAIKQKIEEQIIQRIKQQQQRQHQQLEQQNNTNKIAVQRISISQDNQFQTTVVAGGVGVAPVDNEVASSPGATSLEVRAQQVVPSKMYHLPPVNEDNDQKPKMATTSTSMTPLSIKEDIDDEPTAKDHQQPRKFAHKEGHFIPGQSYAGIKTLKNDDEQTAKSVVLKQMQPKKFNAIHLCSKMRRSPKTSNENCPSLYKNPSHEAQDQQFKSKIAAFRHSTDTENAGAGTPRRLGEGDSLAVTLQRNANNINMQNFEQQESQRLLNLKIETGAGPDEPGEIMPQFIKSYEVNQGCGTDENWTTIVQPHDLDIINQPPTSRQTDDPQQQQVKIIEFGGQPLRTSQISSESNNMHFESEVSFEVRPRIQPNYNISKMSRDSDGRDSFERGGTTGRGGNSKKHQNSPGKKQSSVVSRGSNRTLSQGTRDSQLVKGTVGYAGPIQTVIRNGQPVLVSKLGRLQLNQQHQPRVTEPIVNSARGGASNAFMGLDRITKRQNYNEKNIQFPIQDHNLRKSVARESINTVNSMLEKKMRETLQSEQSAAASTQFGQIAAAPSQDYYSRQHTATDDHQQRQPYQQYVMSQESTRPPSQHRLESRMKGSKNPTNNHSPRASSLNKTTHGGAVQVQQQQQNQQYVRGGSMPSAIPPAAVHKIVAKRKKSKRQPNNPVTVKVYSSPPATHHQTNHQHQQQESPYFQQGEQSNNNMILEVQEFSSIPIKSVSIPPLNKNRGVNQQGKLPQHQMQQHLSNKQNQQQRMYQMQYLRPAKGLVLQKRFQQPLNATNTGETTSTILTSVMTTEEDRDAQDFEKTLRMKTELRQHTPTIIREENSPSLEATPLVQNRELKVIAQMTQPLSAKLDVDIIKSTFDGRSVNDLPSDSADYSPINMSPVKTIREQDNQSSQYKLASQTSQIGCISIKDQEKQKSQLLASPELKPLNSDITIVSSKM